MAAAIGAGLPVGEPTGNMVVDVGGGTSEVAVISLGGIVVSQSIRIGGDELDDAIINYVKREYKLMIGQQTAEEVKLEIGSAYPLGEEVQAEIRGRDLVSGLPKTVVPTSEEVRLALEEPLQAIIDAVKETLDRTPRSSPPTSWTAGSCSPGRITVAGPRRAPSRRDADARASRGVAVDMRCRRVRSIAGGVRGDPPQQPEFPTASALLAPGVSWHARQERGPQATGGTRPARGPLVRPSHPVLRRGRRRRPARHPARSPGCPRADRVGSEPCPQAGARRHRLDRRLAEREERERRAQGGGGTASPAASDERDGRARGRPASRAGGPPEGGQLPERRRAPHRARDRPLADRVVLHASDRQGLR